MSCRPESPSILSCVSSLTEVYEPFRLLKYDAVPICLANVLRKLLCTVTTCNPAWLIDAVWALHAYMPLLVTRGHV